MRSTVGPALGDRALAPLRYWLAEADYRARRHERRRHPWWRVGRLWRRRRPLCVDVMAHPGGVRIECLHRGFVTSRQCDYRDLVQ